MLCSNIIVNCKAAGRAVRCPLLLLQVVGQCQVPEVAHTALCTCNRARGIPVGECRRHVEQGGCHAVKHGLLLLVGEVPVLIERLERAADGNLIADDMGSQVPQDVLHNPW